MASPFPGMDPYLENPALWAGVHDGLIYTLSVELNACLPEGYYSRRQARLYVARDERDIVPDVAAFHQQEFGSYSSGRTKVLAPHRENSLPITLKLEKEEISEAFIEIRHKESLDKVITVIEVLSPSNKARGSAGYREYRKKQKEIMASSINLIEIDLLRYGSHVVAPPQESIVNRYGTWDYLISLSRWQDRTEFQLWLLTARQQLPEILVPLLPEDEDVSIDLQAAFNRFYEEDRYDISVSYEGDPYFPLLNDDADWAKQLLQEKDFQ